jgi:thiol-disulfide isomerase/thioredoxin
MQIEIDLEKIRNYDTPLKGRGIASTNLQETLDSEPLVILYFLRHLGCTHCKYLVNQLAELKRDLPRFPDVIFVHMEDLDEGEAFFAENYPGARHISDPNKELYDLFGIKRGGTKELLNPRMIGRTIQRMFKGYSNTVKPTADASMLSGMFLFRSGNPIWAHRATFAGDDDKAYNMLKMMGKTGENSAREKTQAAEAASGSDSQ